MAGDHVGHRAAEGSDVCPVSQKNPKFPKFTIPQQDRCASAKAHFFATADTSHVPVVAAAKPTRVLSLDKRVKERKKARMQATRRGEARRTDTGTPPLPDLRCA